MYLSGKEIILQKGPYEAHIVTVGAALCKLTYKGYNLVLEHDANSVANAHLNKILVPWPNRIYAGNYSIDGTEYSLPINDKSSNCAIHGMLAWSLWKVKKRTIDKLVLTNYVVANPYYPFMLKAKVTYKLSKNFGLKVNIKLTNISSHKAPVAIGVHPYITSNNEKIDQCKLVLPKLYKAVFDDKFILKELSDCKDEQKFTQANLIGAYQVDNCFSVAQDEYTVTLIGSKISTYLKSNSKYLQLYSAEKMNREGFAVEPMTDCVNAFNQKHFKDYLEPHDSLKLSFIISAQEN